jgi:glycopeptide antibiotics resistance protein
MKRQAHDDPEPRLADFRWSRRILVLALIGIFFLTLYPFRLSFHRHPGVFPFLLAGGEKLSGSLDVFLNILLFVPFGFGLAGVLRKRGIPRTKVLILAFAAGAVLSYSIEFAQFFVVNRDSGWEDVVTNSTGALVGGSIFYICGALLLRLLRHGEQRIECLATATNVSFALLIYFALWLALAARLQQKVTLNAWHTESVLAVGGPAHRWAGRVYDLEFWDHSLSDRVAANLTSSVAASPLNFDPIAAYDFTGSEPFDDARNLLPALVWLPKEQTTPDSPTLTLNGRSSLATETPTSGLVKALQKTGQFSIHFRCTPARADGGVDGQIISIAPPGDPPGLEIRQEDVALSFWFRNGLTASPYKLEWSIPAIFSANRTRNLLFSYDGAKLSLFVDGRLFYDGYRLGPATALALHFRHVKAQELRGYRYIFYAIIFFPVGCLLGIVLRNVRARPLGPIMLMIFGIVLPSVLLEIIIVHVGGQPVSLGNMLLSDIMAAAGWIWINLEGSAAGSLRQSAVSPLSRQ